MWCVAPFCKNTSDGNDDATTESKGISFHDFPHEVGLRAAWLRALGKQDSLLPDSAVVCSQHFLDDEICETESGLRQLATGAVPSTVQVCMICLHTDSKLFLMSKYKMEEAYENLTGYPPYHVGNLKQTLCIQCAQRLRMFSQFRDKSLRARAIMMDLVEKHELVTRQHIKMINHTKYQLGNNLVVTTLGPDPCDLYIQEHPSEEQQTDSEVTLQTVEVKKEGSYDSDMSVDEGMAAENDDSNVEYVNDEFVASKEEYLIETKDPLKYETALIQCSLCCEQLESESAYEQHMDVHSQVTTGDGERDVSPTCEARMAASSSCPDTSLRARHGMPFKIVKTLEKGKYTYLIAPSCWESNNIVKWPKHNASKLAKCAKSVPQADWRDIKCQVQRSNIPTYEDAERELDFLLKANTDTDDDTRVSKSKQASQKEVTLNVLLEPLVANQENSSVNSEPHNQPVFTVPDNPSVITVPNEVNASSQIILTSRRNESLGTHCMVNEGQENFIDKTQESIDINKALTNINLVLEKQDKMLAAILDSQKKMMHKMAGISIQIDKVQSQLNSNFNETQVAPIETLNKRAENIPFSVAPINSIDELNKLEKLLSEKQAREELKEIYSVVCPGGRGVNCAYILIDIMFTRDFLCEFSWSGSSRSDSIKISMKGYKNIVSFFWEVIFNWDHTYTIEENESFFRNILKNSTKRKNAKFERTSTARKRAKSATHKLKKTHDKSEHQEKEQLSERENNKNK